MENPTCTRADDVSENKTNQKEEKHSCTDRAWFLVVVADSESQLYNC